MKSLLSALFLPALIVSLFVTGSISRADEREKASPYPVDSPEHQALSAASPSLADEAFSLRQDYWKGDLTTRAGTALKLQFFKGNTYRLFFGVAPSALAPGAILHLHLIDSSNAEVSHAAGKPGEAAVALHFENTLKTGLYLVLMRVELPPGPLTETEVPAAMFYGWQ
jgi:hypothetical protein